MHRRLKPGKSNGALSDRNKAESRIRLVSYILTLKCLNKKLILLEQYCYNYLPVRGLNTTGEMMFATELMPDMHP